MTWTDVTVVPGLRPRMRTTVLDRPRSWTEVGDFGPFSARLTLTFIAEAVDPAACQVAADFAVAGLGAGAVLARLARPAVAADLRRAARLLTQA